MVCAFTVTTACSRYELRRDTCDPVETPEPHSGVAWRYTADAHRVTGQVRDLDGNRLRHSKVSLAAMSPPAQFSRNQLSDSMGRFVFDSVLSGRYIVSVRMLGYAAARDSVRVARDSGVTVTAVMVPRGMMLDGCGYGWVRVRKPWWKVW